MFILKIITKVINYFKTQLEFFKTSTGYSNTHYVQKKWVKTAIKEYERGSLRSWGKSIEEEDMLGDYLKIRDEFLLPNINNKSVLELGCLDGKWSQYIVPNARHTFLVDLSKNILPVLLNKLNHPKINKYTFYETKGDELKGIQDKSIDFIFCIDTLVRVSKQSIRKYFNEFNRILKNDGKMLIHLPCNMMNLSVKHNFTDLSLDELTEFLNKNSFNDFIFDSKIINHGVLLKYGF